MRIGALTDAVVIFRRTPMLREAMKPSTRNR